MCGRQLLEFAVVFLLARCASAKNHIEILSKKSNRKKNHIEISRYLGTVNLVLASALATCDKRIEKSEKTDLKNMIDRRQRQPAARAPSAAHLRPKNSLASAKNANVFKGKIKHKTQKRPCKPQSALAKRLAAGTRRRAIPIAAASHLRPIDRPKTSIKCENFYENFIKFFCKSWKFLADFRASSGPRLSSF
jgi:hypothetical protein